VGGDKVQINVDIPSYNCISNSKASETPVPNFRNRKINKSCWVVSGRNTYNVPKPTGFHLNVHLRKKCTQAYGKYAGKITDLLFQYRGTGCPKIRSRPQLSKSF
jgi:hypothetical protein